MKRVWVVHLRSCSRKWWKKNYEFSDEMYTCVVSNQTRWNSVINLLFCLLLPVILRKHFSYAYAMHVFPGCEQLTIRPIIKIKKKMLYLCCWFFVMEGWKEHKHFYFISFSWTHRHTAALSKQINFSVLFCTNVYVPEIFATDSKVFPSGSVMVWLIWKLERGKKIKLLPTK